VDNSSSKTQQVENVIVDEANRRTYVILAPRVLTDGEMYKAIRQEILRRGGRTVPPGETLTFTFAPRTPSGAAPRASRPPPEGDGSETTVQE
jgi:hypothetical protein